MNLMKGVILVCENFDSEISRFWMEYLVNFDSLQYKMAQRMVIIPPLLYMSTERGQMKLSQRELKLSQLELKEWRRELNLCRWEVPTLQFHLKLSWRELKFEQRELPLQQFHLSALCGQANLSRFIPHFKKNLMKF
jgi:hypothetical protein